MAETNQTKNMRDFKDIRVAVAGTGYVGLSIATLLSQHHHVTAVDVIPEKVEKLNNKISPIQDDYIEKYLAEKPLNLVATLDGKSAYADADFVVIAAPTNYDPVKNYFDTTHVEEVIDLVLEVNPDAIMVIKSTIPVGYTRNLYLKYAQKGVKKFNLLFSPEFLRESKALYDNLYPSRIIVGYPKIINKPEFEAENKAIESVTDVNMLIEAAKTFAALLQEGAIKENTKAIYLETLGNPNSDIPRAGAKSDAALPSDFMIHDASYLRLKNVTLAYTFDLRKKCSWLRDLTLSVSGENLYLWKKYNGFDPDVSSEGTSSTLRRMDLGAYPKPRTIIFSIQLRY